MKKQHILLLSIISILSCNSYFQNTLADETNTAAQTTNQTPIDPKIARSILKVAPKEIKAILELLKNPDRETKAPHAVLLYGEPGTGKTTLAQIIAQEAGIDYIIIQAPFLANQYKNSGTEKIKEIFGEALATNKPIIIIIDELHSITENHTTNNPDKNVAEALWLALDECKNNKNVYVIATTNYKDRMPSQLKDRFGYGITRVEISSKNTLEQKMEILETHLEIKKLYECNKSCLKELAEKMGDAHPREIEQLVSQAEIWADQRNPQNKKIEREDFDRPLESLKKKHNEEKNKNKETDRERRERYIQNTQIGAYSSTAALALATIACFAAQALNSNYQCGPGAK